MLLISRFITRLYDHVVLLKGWVILAAVVSYLAASWILFALAGEEALVSSLANFLYFASTTASTVGYGDLSPQTPAGRLIAALFFFPGAVTIFTVVLAKVTGTVVEGVRRMADGKGNYSKKEGATVLVGYHADRTDRMLADLRAGADDDHTIVVLARAADIALHDSAFLVVADKLDSSEALRRAAVEHASKVLVYANSDAETFNACLAIRELNPNVHVAAYFNDRETAARARRFAQVETVVSISTEALVRAAQDPGTSEVLRLLSSSTTGSTVYSAVVNGSGCASDRIREGLNSADATLIAVRQDTTEGDLLFAPFPERLESDTIAYYIAKNRIDDSAWLKIQQGAR